MSPNPILSILTPAVPSRLPALELLCNELTLQIADQPVEHLVLLDNKRRTVGEKRDALLRAARGKYIAFVDDDDWVAPHYVEELLKAASQNPDVITFEQWSTVDGKDGKIVFRLGSPNEVFRPGGTARRNAWHICAWARNIAVYSAFPAVNFGEDWAWAARVCSIPNLQEIHIPQVLHYYRHSSATTEAPPPGAPARDGNVPRGTIVPIRHIMEAT